MRLAINKKKVRHTLRSYGGQSTPKFRGAAKPMVSGELGEREAGLVLALGVLGCFARFLEAVLAALFLTSIASK
jgi:hypothetical protein